MLRLDQFPSHQWATVTDLRRPEAAEDRDLVLRLTEIGFVPGEAVRIVASGQPGREPLAVRLRIDTPIEVDYYVHGGILPFVLRQLLSS